MIKPLHKNRCKQGGSLVTAGAVTRSAVMSGSLRGDPGDLEASLSPDDAHQQGHKEDHDEDEEQDLCDFSRASGDPAETEDGGDDGDDEENGSITKHEGLPPLNCRID
ncbi:hypothetical protein P3T21_003441 [Paraburkholderia sp. GAS334]